ncbi:MAG: UDP-N-acetyl glucosamine 2-epimerase [Ginsengibacter sp.]
MKTILHIVGTRPQFIKLAVLHNQLAGDSSFSQKIIHTGQHFSYNMNEIFFDQLNLPVPDINFNLHQSSSNLFIGEAADMLQDYFFKNDDSVVFVYGDTNTTVAAAIAAKRCKLPLIHFEAGVRTHDLSMPEEINRLITDRLATVNYCCTAKNFETMKAEGYDSIISSQLILTGDLMLDAFLKIKGTIKKVIDEKEYIACTIHRHDNLNNKENLKAIINALNKINDFVRVAMPVHPHTEKRMQEYNIVPSFKVLAPLGYPDMKTFLSNSAFVITDSGGTSREAYFSQKKSLIVMEKPFWPEIIETNCALNSIANEDSILEGFHQLSFLNADFTTQIFGDGHAAETIYQHLSANIDNL